MLVKILHWWILNNVNVIAPSVTVNGIDWPINKWMLLCRCMRNLFRLNAVNKQCKHLETSLNTWWCQLIIISISFILVLVKTINFLVKNPKKKCCFHWKAIRKDEKMGLHLSGQILQHLNETPKCIRTYSVKIVRICTRLHVGHPRIPISKFIVQVNVISFWRSSK